MDLLTTNIPPSLLTVQEVMGILKCCRATVYNLMDDGALTYSKPKRTRKRLIHTDSLRHLIERSAICNA